MLRALVLALMLTAAAPIAAAELPSAAEAALQHLLDGARESHSDAVLVLRDGQELGHYYADGASPGPIELMSATKSVVALGIGQLIGQGRIESLDQPVADFYPEWRQGRKRDITIRMLLNHTSGLQNVRNTTVEIYPAPDVVQLALAAELVSDPGERFAYNNKAANLLAGIIEKASGQPMDVFFREGLFAALGLQAGEWHKDSAGNPHAMAGLPLTAADAARIGQLMLDGGRYGGQQLVPADYIEAMLAPGQDMVASCGLLWWRRSAWTHFSYDPGSEAMLRERGVPDAVVRKVSQALTGARYDNTAALRDGLSKRLGPDLARVRSELIDERGISLARLFDIERGPVVAYEAQGYLGQFIVVVPAAGLVAVRQRRSPDGDAPQPEGDSYADFTHRVIALARAVGELPPAPSIQSGVAGHQRPVDMAAGTVAPSPR